MSSAPMPDDFKPPLWRRGVYRRTTKPKEKREMAEIAVGAFVRDPGHPNRGAGWIKEVNEETDRALVRWDDGGETLEWISKMKEWPGAYGDAA